MLDSLVGQSLPRKHLHHRKEQTECERHAGVDSLQSLSSVKQSKGIEAGLGGHGLSSLSLHV